MAELCQLTIQPTLFDDRDWDCDRDGHWFTDNVCVVCGVHADRAAVGIVRLLRERNTR